MESIELKKIWEQIKTELLSALPENAHPWVYPLEAVDFEEGVLTVVTGQIMGRDLLKKNYYLQIVDVIKNVSQNKNADFVIIYDEKAQKSIKKENEKIEKKMVEASLKEQAMQNLSVMQSRSNLNLKYKFENFVVGKNNEFAYNVALKVAQQPSKKYNPLFIYGKSGLGKTHLMQAIGHYCIFNNSDLKVKYTKTEDYIDDFITNCRTSNTQIENMSKFNKKYTNVDVILIDDIQYIESKKKTMSQMQHTFDSLYNKGKQVVITSDRPPKEIATLSSALCSRFEMGLMIELVPPELQNRIDILKKMAADNDIEYTEDALKYIAQHYDQNVRELEGAFNRVQAYAEMRNEILSYELAKDVLKCAEIDNSITYDKIVHVTAEYFNLDQNDILGSARGQKITQARHVAVYLCRTLTNTSFVDIANFFNKKHTTIMFANDKVKKEVISDKNIDKAIKEIKQGLHVI